MLQKFILLWYNNYVLMISYYILLFTPFHENSWNFFEKTRGILFTSFHEKSKCFSLQVWVFFVRISIIFLLIHNIFTFVPCRKLIFLKSNKGRQNSTSFQKFFWYSRGIFICLVWITKIIYKFSHFHENSEIFF